MTPATRPLRLALAFAGAVLAAACYDFHLAGPEDPPALPQPRLVTVAIEYRQPNGCVNVPERCDHPVVFFGSWMRPGGEFELSRDVGSFVWTGRATGVPVNFPPRDQPYEVRIYDPHLGGTSTLGFTAGRLTVGGQLLTAIQFPGSPREHALVFVDDNGQGHSPF
jgi:hypothetical protein